MIGFYIVFVILVTLLSVYITVNFHKFYIIKQIENKRKGLSWIVASIPSLILILFGIPYTMYSVVIAFHLAILFFIFDIIQTIIKKSFKLEFKCYIAGIIAIIVSIGYFSYAWVNAHNVIETDYSIKSEKLDTGESLKIAQITDLHMGTTFDAEGFSKYLDEIVSKNPDVIVVTGDFVDESTSYEDMVKASEALGKVNVKYGVYFIYGNHDLHVYGGNQNYTDEDLAEELKKNNINVLEDETVLIDNQFYICGRRDATVKDRKSTEELLEGIDKSKFVLLLDHQPLEYSEADSAGADLLLSGHTHGGQILPLAYISTLVSKNEMVYGIKEVGNTTCIVSSGISEWGFGFRTGAVTEYVMITVES